MSHAKSSAPSKSSVTPFGTESGNESRISDTDDGQDLFDRSPSPEETFSDAEGANSDGEWPLEIIGEEVDHLGEIRYEVKWDSWRRNSDGTNTTWNNSLVPPAVIRDWDRRRAQRRYSKAQKQSLGVEIRPSIRVTDLPTMWRYDAVEERLHVQKGYSLLDDLIRAKQVARISKRVNSSQRRSSRLPLTRSPTMTSKPMARTLHHAPPVTIKTEKRRRVDDSPVPESPPRLIEPSIEEAEKLVTVPKRIGRPSKRVKVQSVFRERKLSGQLYTPQRKKLVDDWTEAAKTSEATYITFTNELDAEEVPRLPPAFKYIENGYLYSNDVPKPSDLDEAIFLQCDCQPGCRDPDKCGCQEVSDLVDECGEKAIAYDAKGLLMIDITPGMLVVECNEYCKCDLSCRNRISQRPRKIPIDIFKTINRGWGARPLYNVPKGTVLGIYSGKLIKRSEAEKLDAEERGYCFDLDGQENLFENVEEQQGTYTVDAHDCGNWTRFVNHSCSSNLHVYQAVHNTIPELNTPVIVFCAKVDIPAKCELTVDYDPREAPGPVMKKKKKGKRKSSVEIPEGAIQCRCGEEECRRWVRVLA
ncbi:hypothetical protein M378DRAFT_166739 [Amanita muscaria Koide BX008]|uniref:SET domain-containing protein n=1 Tax=Amanita muscaria (strain Koide BX008) TaxID=946122 RepID=A0A0C2WYY3_AMAMK|nr:hypothetical protein M378DRAFT_166739 [Amanita muscaria Koide BX008]